MATLLHMRNVRVFLPSRDHRDPPHVHVESGDCVSKWELEGWRCVDRGCCSAGDLRKIRSLLVEYEVEIVANWTKEWRHRGQ